ncbi:MAG TPA: cytochrome c biogenesis protein CcdA [Acidimicrobiales bacterium]|nr:cytochrome c biogenesis protein CcdA [Acidimicrobiales bacterium]
MVSAPVGYVAAFGGGVISFVSPCVLPVVPGYLSVVTGLDLYAGEDGAAAGRRALRICRETGLFILGFGVVFVLLELAATSLSAALVSNKVLLTRISGGVVLAMALFLAGSMIGRAPWLYREARFHPDLSRFGPLAAPIAGIAFGFGWTPCLGPILASIIAISSTRGASGGAGLLTAYTLGLGVPFLAVGLAFTRLAGAIGWLRRHSNVIVLASVSLLAVFGVVLLLNRLTWVTSELETAMRSIGLGRLVTAG